MKKAVLLALISFASVASAAVSQQQAGINCNPYSLDGETIQVVGPISCEGSFWVCEFVYYGNKQNLVMPVNSVTGSVVNSNSNLITDIISTKYAVDSGSPYIFGTSLDDESFAINLRGMNSTLQNYGTVLRSLKDDGSIAERDYNRLTSEVSSLKTLTGNLADEIDKLANESKNFEESPDCVELIKYLSDFNKTLTLAKNFSSEWNAFITQYNNLVSSLEGAYIATINPSDAQIFAKDLVSMEALLREYLSKSAESNSKSLENLKTREERKTTKEKLDQAYQLVKDSGNEGAIAKYNSASEAFNKGEYLKSRGFSNEAIALVSSSPPPDGDGDEPEPVTSTDYTPYFIIIGVMVGVLVVVTLLKKRPEGKDDEDDTKGDRKERRDKKVPKGNWEWSKEDKGALGGAGGLD